MGLNGIHELKILPQYFEKVLDGTKKFELRKNDRNYKIGDLIRLYEYDGKKYTGRCVIGAITYILCDCDDFGLLDGYCILGFE